MRRWLERRSIRRDMEKNAARYVESQERLLRRHGEIHKQLQRKLRDTYKRPR